MVILCTNPGQFCGSVRVMQPPCHWYENSMKLSQLLTDQRHSSLDSGIESSSLNSDDSSLTSGGNLSRRADEHYKVPRKTPVQQVSKSQEDDLQIVSKNVLKLKESGCYYPNMPQEEARRILKGLSEGYFLIRNSASPSYLFSLTVRTTKGPTSIRIRYHSGTFKLDSTTKHNLPTFDSVMDLLEFYMGLSKPKSLQGMGASIILDTSGKKTEVKLTNPYIRQTSSLRHLCRITLFRNLRSPDQVTGLPLSDSCKTFLKKYTHKI